jgi:hypothetical protein
MPRPPASTLVQWRQENPTAWWRMLTDQEPGYKPEQYNVSSTSTRHKVIIVGIECGHRREMTPQNLTKRKGCHECRGHNRTAMNAWMNEHPNIWFRLLNVGENGYKDDMYEVASSDARHKIIVKCKTCASEVDGFPTNLTREASSCSRCHDGRRNY